MASEKFHDAGFSDIWYAHPGGAFKDSNRRFHAGVWTGPEYDLISVKRCATNEEANWWLSPGGNTVEEAVELALVLLKMGPVEFDKQFPDYRSPVNLDNYGKDVRPPLASCAPPCVRDALQALEVLTEILGESLLADMPYREDLLDRLKALRMGCEALRIGQRSSMFAQEITQRKHPVPHKD